MSQRMMDLLVVFQMPFLLHGRTWKTDRSPLSSHLSHGCHLTSEYLRLTPPQSQQNRVTIPHLQSLKISEFPDVPRLFELPR